MNITIFILSIIYVYFYPRVKKINIYQQLPASLLRKINKEYRTV